MKVETAALLWHDNKGRYAFVPTHVRTRIIYMYYKTNGFHFDFSISKKIVTMNKYLNGANEERECQRKRDKV